MRYGSFYILPDLGDNFSSKEGDFCRLEYTKILDTKNESYLPFWTQIIWCTFNSMVRNKGYKAQDIGLVMYSSNQSTV